MNENVKNFKKNKYVVLKNVIDKNFLNFIAQYTLFDEMQNFSPEGGKYENIQMPNSHGKYADPLMESMLLYIWPMIEENTGLELLPTYSYYRIYNNGDYLVKHVDRESCEISCTIPFLYEYKNKEYNWPIFINDHLVQMDIGDIAIYKGIEVSHYREKLEAGKESFHIQGFFHFVDSNGLYKEWKFDKRDSIGINPEKPKNNKKYITFT